MIIFFVLSCPPPPKLFTVPGRWRACAVVRHLCSTRALPNVVTIVPLALLYICTHHISDATDTRRHAHAFVLVFTGGCVPISGVSATNRR